MVRIAVSQFCVERLGLAVNQSSHAAVADVGVDCVGEVDGGGAPRQFFDLTFRSKQVDDVGEEINLDVLKEVAGISGLD